MKPFALFPLLALPLSSLKGQSDVRSHSDRDPFDPTVPRLTTDEGSARLEKIAESQKFDALASLKGILIPGFEAQIPKPSLRFSTLEGVELIYYDKTRKMERITGLLKELKEALKPSVETECEDWVQIKSDTFSKQGTKVFLLFPDLTPNTKSPFSGIRVYDSNGRTSELMFKGQEAAPSWAKLIGELQVQIKTKRSEQAVPPNRP